MFSGIGSVNYGSAQPGEVSGKGSSVTRRLGGEEHLRIERDTKVRRVTTIAGLYSAGEVRAPTLGHRVRRQPSWKRICINLGLFAIGAGLYCTYMYLQFSRLRRS